MKKVLGQLNYLLFPLLSALITAALIHGIHCLFLLGILPLNATLYLGFIPIAVLEYFFSSRYLRRRSTGQSASKSYRRWIGISGNIIFWLLIYLFWVVFMASMKDQAPGLVFYGPRIYLFVFMLLRSTVLLTLLGVFLWFLLHYWISVRNSRFRLLTSLVLPSLIAFSIFFFQFKLGGAGGFSLEDIVRQPGVEQMLSLAEIRQSVQSTPPVEQRILSPKGLTTETSKVDFRYHPRGLLVDEQTETLFAFQGCTYCPIRRLLPIIIRKNLTSGEIATVLSENNIRQVYDAGTSFYMAPWMDSYIYQIGKRDLSILQAIDNQTAALGIYWEPMAILEDKSAGKLYVANEIHAALLRYDLETRKLDGVLDMEVSGLTGEGGTTHSMMKSQKTGMIYFVSMPGENTLFEMSPESFTITRKLALGESMITATLLDDEDGKLYYQSAIYDTIYVIDRDKFKVLRTIEGEFHSRFLRLDRKRGVLYSLGFISGSVFPIDLDSGEKLWRVKVGGRPSGMVYKSDALWVNSMHGVFKLNLNQIWQDKGYAGSKYDLAIH